MKNKFLKLIALSAAFALGAGLALNQSKAPLNVEALQYLDDYEPYVYSGSYYNTIDFDASNGMNGALRKAITSLIKPKGFYTYGSTGADHLSTQLQYADEDPTNSSNMVYLYTRDSVKKNAASSWNREHVWPQSLSNGNWGTDYAGTDILHIRPTYNSTNNTRGNTPYGDNNKSGPQYYNNMLFGYTGGSYFEPIDEVKGDVARIIMYVWTAYTGYSASSVTYSNFSITDVFQSYDTLLRWHTLDKPDELEGNRNDYCQTSIQKNRNPFVDHPELAWRFFGDSASSSVKNACMEAYPLEGYNPDQKQLSSIQLSGEAVYKNYYAGQSFNPLGLTVTANYTDGSSKQISNDSCTWLPDPLTEGTTSITCKYGNCSATYSGITVTKRTSIGGEYSVEFLNESTSGTEINSSNIAEHWKNNSLVKSVSNCVKIFPGDNGLKFGSSSVNGDITFNLVDNAQNNIVKVSIKTTKYNGNGGFTAVLGSLTLGSGISAGSTFTKDLQNVDATTLRITSSGRMFLNSITIEVADTTPVPPTSSSSLPPQSSSSSAKESSSSALPISSSSSSVPISSSETPISSSEQVISSESTSEDISSMPSSQEETSQNSSIQDTSSSSNEENKKSTHGCGGSIAVSLSLTSFSALIGLVFVFSKKKK